MLQVVAPELRGWLSRSRVGPYAVAGVSLLVATIVILSDLGTPSAAPPAAPSVAPSPAAETLEAGTIDDLPITLRPYPYFQPTPAAVPTEIDGTYMLILTLEDLGGANNALPFPCRRCLPYARDPGVVTLILFDGAYFVDHQMSGFRATGSYEVDGKRLMLFNDPNCSRIRGTYTWRLDGASLSLKAVDDSCAYKGNVRSISRQTSGRGSRSAGVRFSTSGPASSGASGAGFGG